MDLRQYLTIYDIIYHRPNFDFHASESYHTTEQITVPSSNSGRWYILLYGHEPYQGVSLTAGYDGTPKTEADFDAIPYSGQVPLTVNFSDRSSGDISSWVWNFGDGATSTAQNPFYSYNAPGTYPVSFTVTGSSGSDTESKTNFIRTWSEQSQRDVEAFVTRFYQQFLARDPDQTGLEN